MSENSRTRGKNPKAIDVLLEITVLGCYASIAEHIPTHQLQQSCWFTEQPPFLGLFRELEEAVVGS